MLKEVGFLAGQHEVLAESFTKEQNKGVISEVKRLKNARSENIKEANKITADLKMAHSKMDKAKVKFRKAYEEQERSAEAYKKANDDGSVTRNEVTKMRGTATKRSQECENAKGKYASQLVNTNDFQTRSVKCPKIIYVFSCFITLKFQVLH
jgi:septation ring formation regulator EzrA